MEVERWRRILNVWKYSIEKSFAKVRVEGTDPVEDIMARCSGEK